MTRRYKTASGGDVEIRAYVKRADELWKHASNAHRDSDYDATAILVIHSCISLADAACIAHQGSRYAGTSHDEAVQYFYDLGIPGDDFKKACRRLGQVISEKNAAEYGGSNLTGKNADSIHKNGERFREYLFGTILKKYQ